jgi:HEAT repeat protein
MSIACTFFAILLAQQPAPTDAEFKEQIARLEAKEKADRLDALSWLARHAKAKNAELAIPALERCIRADPEAPVRESAIVSRTDIALHLKKPCPLVIVEAMLDKDETVSQAADLLAGRFKQFEPGSLDVLLRVAQTDWGKYAGTVMHLAKFGTKEKRAMAAIESALKDKSFGVRHNAHCARFQATDNLQEFLSYFIRVRDNPDRLLGDIDITSEAGKREKSFCNLAQIGAARLKAEWSETRADDFAAALLKLLDDPSPVLRRGATQDIGASAAKIDLSEFDPLNKKQPEAKEPPQKSKVALKLAKLGVEARLRELRDSDPDKTVRAAARSALERWTLLFKE